MSKLIVDLFTQLPYMTTHFTIIISSIVFFLFTLPSFCQNSPKTKRKGSISIAWGWNWTDYSGSDIQFKGQGHNFTLHNVKASNRPSDFNFNTYFVHLTTPQYNLKISYFLNEHWNVSVGVDHMKYVMNQNQFVNISGEIDMDTEYDGQYNNTPIQLTTDFLTFEHTDGLNYLYLGINRFDELFNLEEVGLANISFGLTEGFSAGIHLPRTNSRLLGGERHDEFHLAGYGFDINLGLNITFYDYFFLEGQIKVGYVNMPDIRSTTSTLDSANQTFFYSHYSIMIGANIPLIRY